MTATGARASAKFEHKRELILASAAQRFNERGVKGATLADVATGVGLSLKSLRYYFKRKDILVAEDRKSTRLNSSHVKISYAVVCLKKKKIGDKKCHDAP